jgi:uncharacterized protein YcbX
VSGDAAAVVSGLALTPVKGTRLRSVSEIVLGRAGVRENRRFFLIDARDRMVNGKTLGELNAVIADYLDAERELTLTFPDGIVIGGRVEPKDQVTARFFSDEVAGRLVDGPWSAALSSYVGQPLRIVEAPDERSGVDRGAHAAVSLISRGSLARLAHEGGEPDVDVRRFRMLIEADGVDAHEEDGWVDRTVRIGDALVAMHGHVGRCLITSRDPDTGEIDLPTLDILGGYRQGLGTTEPLPFGVYGEVLEEGVIRLGDAISPE